MPRRTIADVAADYCRETGDPCVWNGDPDICGEIAKRAGITATGAGSGMFPPHYVNNLVLKGLRTKRGRELFSEGRIRAIGYLTEREYWHAAFWLREMEVTDATTT